MNLKFGQKPTCEICHSEKIAHHIKNKFYCRRHKPKKPKQLIGRYSGRSEWYEKNKGYFKAPEED